MILRLLSRYFWLITVLLLTLAVLSGFLQGCARLPKSYTMSFDKDCIYSFMKPEPDMPLMCWCRKEFANSKPTHTPVHKMRCNR